MNVHTGYGRQPTDSWDASRILSGFTHHSMPYGTCAVGVGWVRKQCGKVGADGGFGLCNPGMAGLGRVLVDLLSLCVFYVVGLSITFAAGLTCLFCHLFVVTADVFQFSFFELFKVEQAVVGFFYYEY
jgi:hypothetical protein